MANKSVKNTLRLKKQAFNEKKKDRFALNDVIFRDLKKCQGFGAIHYPVQLVVTLELVGEM